MAYIPKGDYPLHGPLLTHGNAISIKSLEDAIGHAQKLSKELRDLGHYDNLGRIRPENIEAAKEHLGSKEEWFQLPEQLASLREMKPFFDKFHERHMQDEFPYIGNVFGSSITDVDDLRPHILHKDPAQRRFYWKNGSDEAENHSSGHPLTPKNATYDRLMGVLSAANHPAVLNLLEIYGNELPDSTTIGTGHSKLSAYTQMTHPGKSSGKTSFGKAIKEIDHLLKTSNPDAILKIREFVRNEPNGLEAKQLDISEITPYRKAIEALYIYKKRIHTEDEFISFIKGRNYRDISSDAVIKDPAYEKSNEDEESSFVYRYVKRKPTAEFIDLLLLRLAIDEYVAQKRSS